MMSVVQFAFVGVWLWSMSNAYGVPHDGIYPRQAISNSSVATSTVFSSTSAFSTPTITAASSLATQSSIPASANGTCPTTYPTNYPVSFSTWSNACVSLQASVLDTNYYDYADRCLGEYCRVSWSSAVASYASAGIKQTTTSTRTWFQGFYGSGSLSTVIVTQSYWTSTYTFVENPFQAVKPISPCCSSCTISAQTIQLFFWPTAVSAPTPSVTGLPANATAAVTGLPVAGSGSYVDENGFTFISPSVYIGFTSLGAHDRCGPVGETYYNTTMAFDPDEISSILPYATTATCIVTVPKSEGGGTSAAIAISKPPPQPLTYADVAQNCSSISGYYFFSDNPSNYFAGTGDPCHPIIAIPTRVNQLQPAWATCGPNYYGGFYDPPKTLQQGPVLVPTATPGQSNPTLAPSTSVPALPENTPTQGPEPPASSHGDPGDPPSSAAQPQQPPSSQPQPPAPASSPINPQPSQPAQPSPGSSTTIVITPPPAVPSNSNTPPPVITLGPEPGSSDPGTVITLIPTVLPTSPGSPSNPNQPVKPSGSVVVIGTQTVVPGEAITVGGTTSTLPNGQITVISGTQVFLVPGATQVIIGGSSTIDLPPAQPTSGDPRGPVVVTFDGSTFTANSASQFVIGTQTLSPGSVITIGGITSILPGGVTTVIGGTTISLAPGASQIVVGGSTIPLTSGPQATSGPLVITLDGTTLTANSLTQFVFGSSTLSVGGPPLTVSGTTYSLTTNAQGSTVLIAGTAGPSGLSPASATTTGSSGQTGSAGVSSNNRGSGSPTSAAPGASKTGGAVAAAIPPQKCVFGLLVSGVILALL